MENSQAGIDTILAQLNEQQQAAASHGNGPLLIVAGAGTGKTTTLANRVAYLITSGIDPGRILLLTFTRRAAAEMLRRVDAILGSLAKNSSRARHRLSSRRVWGGTFHAIATRLLRRHGKLIGLPPEFTILDRSDSEDLMNVLRAEMQLTNAGTRFPLKGTCLAIYSRCVNMQSRRLEIVLEKSFPWCAEHGEGLKRLFEAYVDRKERHAILDYDDLLVFWNIMLEEPKSGDVIRERFDCVLVDEYQDTNVLQAAILKNLRPDGRGLTVVGDDAQSIYSFRAATVRNILDFSKHFPDTTVLALERNYRSTQPILDATNRIIALAAERHEKELVSARGGGLRPVLVDCLDEDEQTEFLIEHVLENRERGTPLKEQAVLFRASHHSLALEVELSRQNIPFHKYGGLKFIETAHIKDLLAFMRLAENPRDLVAGTRVLMLLPGIGQGRARDLMGRLLAANCDFAAWSEYSPPRAAADDWQKFVSLMSSLATHAPQKSEVSVQVHQIRSFYKPLLEQKHDHAHARLRDLEQLEQVSARFRDRTTFLSEITLDPPSSTQDLPADPQLDEDYLILSTVHSAKGLEWNSVYVIHAADGNLPSDMASGSPEEIEEERRLFYVALTRARNQLYVCYPQRYYFSRRHCSDAHGYAQLSRFLPEEVTACFDRRPAAVTESDEDTSAELTTARVRSRMKSMWA